MKQLTSGDHVSHFIPITAHSLLEKKQTTPTLYQEYFRVFFWFHLALYLTFFPYTLHIHIKLCPCYHRLSTYIMSPILIHQLFDCVLLLLSRTLPIVHPNSHWLANTKPIVLFEKLTSPKAFIDPDMVIKFEFDSCFFLITIGCNSFLLFGLDPSDGNTWFYYYYYSLHKLILVCACVCEFYYMMNTCFSLSIGLND